MKNPKISVIVPIYNSEQYLCRCVDSILGQSFFDFECLLVNDGSKDGSWDLCKKYEEKDSRIKVLDKVNGGVSSARNMGIDNAVGEWVAFVDSDDSIESDYFEALYSNSESCQLVCSYATVEYPDRTERTEQFEGSFKSDIIEKMFVAFGLRTNSAPWGKLFNRFIIKEKQIHFDNKMNIGEDTLFLLDYIKHIQRVNIINNHSYHYYINEASLVRRVNSLDSEYYSYLRIKQACKDILSENTEYSIGVSEEMNKMLSAYIRRVLNSLYYNNVNRSERVTAIKRIDTDLFCQYHQTDSFWGLLCILLLRFKMINTYDALRNIASRRKKKD